MYQPRLPQLNEIEQEFAVKFFTFLGNDIKDSTRNQYYALFRRMKKIFGSVRQLDQSELELFLKICIGSVARAFMSNMIDWTRWDIRIPRKRGSKPIRVRSTITYEDQALILKTAHEMFKNKGYTLAILLGFECGLRRAEIIGIHKEDFNMVKYRSDIDEHPKSPCELLIRGKGDKDRIVLVPYRTMRVLIPYMIELKTNKLFNFLPIVLSNKFNKVCKRLGFIDSEGKAIYHVHSMRYTRATRWSEDEDIDIFEIKERLGHSCITTTQIYINPDRTRALSKWRESLKTNY